jgi:hypothetical protein
VVGALVAVLAATLVLWLGIAGWLVSPFGRSYHWQQRIERYTPHNTDTHSILSLKSRHLHMVGEIVCQVTDIEGRTYTYAWRSPHGAGVLPVRKGDGPTIAYPDAFSGAEGSDAPQPIPGKYTVEWTLQSLPGTKRRTLYKSKWEVTD